MIKNNVYIVSRVFLLTTFFFCFLFLQVHGQDILLDNQLLNTSHVYFSPGTITTHDTCPASVRVTGGVRVDFKAAHYIKLSPGFRTDLSAGCGRFHAYTGGRPSQCPTASISGDSVFCGSNPSVLSAASSTPGSGTITSYQWQKDYLDIPGATAISYLALQAGNYSVTVGNSDGCTVISPSFRVASCPFALTPTIVNVACFGGNDGSIHLSVNGGISPYTYTWNNGATSQSISGSQGVYIVTVTDANGLTVMNSFNITEPSLMVVHATAASPIECYGYSTCLDVSATGGSGIYTNGTGQLCGYGAGDYAFVVTDNSGCTGTSGNVHLNEPDKVEGTITVTQTTCGLSTGTATVTPVGGSGTYVSYVWNTSPVQTTQTATGLAAGNYIVIITDYNGCTGTAIASISNTGTSPAQPGSIAGPAAACKGQSGVIYSVTNVPGVSYHWFLPTGATGSSTANSISVNFNTGYSGGFICVSAINGCGTSALSCIPVPVVTGRPAFPAAPSGPSVGVCGPTTVVYSIPPIANTTSYIWTVSGAGLAIASGQGTTSITVNVVAGFASGQVRVYGASCSGISGENVLNVYGVLSSQPQLAIFPIVGICGGSTSTYSVTPFNGASSITWIAPVGSLINGISNPYTTAGNVFSVNITFPPGFVSGNVSVHGSNGCGDGPARVIVVRSAPAQPGVISGPASNVCNQSNVIYSVAAVSGEISYTWTAPAGVTIVSGNGTSSITVNFGSTFTALGNICVTANNICGTSVARCQTVTARPSQPGAINGATSVCKSQSSVAYSVPSIAGVNYAWSVTGGPSVVGAGAGATVNFTTATVASATLTVTASNACGAAAATRTLQVSVNLGCRTANDAAIASEMNAFPNPTSGKLNISFNSEAKEKYILKVTDLAGKVLINYPGTTLEGINLQEVDLSSYAKGMYLLSIERQGGEIQAIGIVVE